MVTELTQPVTDGLVYYNSLYNVILKTVYGKFNVSFDRMRNILFMNIHVTSAMGHLPSDTSKGIISKTVPETKQKR